MFLIIMVLLLVQLSDPPHEALIGDVSARGVWNPQSMAVFNIRVIDSDAPSYLSRTPDAVLLSAEREKKLKYNETCELKHASFTSLCITINGLLGNEMKHFLSRLADKLAIPSGTKNTIQHYTGYEPNYHLLCDQSHQSLH